MAQTAKDYAKEQLGELDLSYLDEEKRVAKNTYDTSTKSLQNSFDNLVSQINSNRTSNRENFNKGRATIAESAYDANRANKLNVSSRVAGQSGLQNLGEVGTRIETGREYSNLANAFYNTMDELNRTQRQAEGQYLLDKESALNEYESTLADIDSRAGAAKNNYNMTLGQLAETVQGRWDSNENAKAALEQQKAAAAQAHRDAVNAARQQLKSNNMNTLIGIVNSIGKKMENGIEYSVDNAIADIAGYFGVDNSIAINVLKQLQRIDRDNNAASSGSVYESDYAGGTDYINQLIGKE